MLAPAAVFVAVVACGGAVAITGNAVMAIVSVGLLVGGLGVAVDTGEASVVRGNLVAIVAHGIVVRNREVCVIESGAEPRCGGVASFASVWVPRGNVVGHGAAESLRAGPSGLVAAIASSIGGAETVIVVDMAGGARRLGGVQMRACQWPAGSAVIKCSRLPSGGVVAGGTL
jgi:hypothetical protein